MKGELSITDVRGLKGIWDIVVDSMIDEQFPPALVDAQLPPSHGRDGAKNREAKAAQRAVQVTRDDVRTKFTRLMKVMEQLPHPIQAVMSGNFGASWAALAVEHMAVPIDGISLMHGSKFGGEWTMLAVVDALPEPQVEEQDPFSGDLSSIT